MYNIENVLIAILFHIFVTDAQYGNNSCIIPEMSDWGCDGMNFKTVRDCWSPNICIGCNLCLDGKWCVSHRILEKTTVDYKKANLAIIFGASYIPRCLLVNLPELRTIHGKNLRIAVVESWAFWNLPKLEKINLSYNSIKEIQHGMFSGLPVHTLDLSWNEISYIGEGAFHNMDNLIRLDLSWNYLTIFDGTLHFFIRKVTGEEKWPPLVELILSHNEIDYIQNLKYLRKLKIIDLSHNKIRVILNDVFYEKLRITKLDLTDNFATEFPELSPKIRIDLLRIAFNNIREYRLLVLDRVTAVTIHGNPWDCHDYHRVLIHVYRSKTKLMSYDEDEKVYFLTEFHIANYPICYVSGDDYSSTSYMNYLDQKEYYKQKSNPYCTTRNDCPDTMICKSRRCWNPCQFTDFCHKTANCMLNDHSLFCQCEGEKLMNPFTVSSKCHNIGCFRDLDCYGKKCNTFKHICE